MRLHSLSWVAKIWRHALQPIHPSSRPWSAHCIFRIQMSGIMVMPAIAKNNHNWVTWNIPAFGQRRRSAKISALRRHAGPCFQVRFCMPAASTSSNCFSNCSRAIVRPSCFNLLDWSLTQEWPLPNYLATCCVCPRTAARNIARRLGLCNAATSTTRARSAAIKSTDAKKTAKKATCQDKPGHCS